MSKICRLLASVLLMLLPLAALAGIKFNPCPKGPGEIDFKEYLVAGSKATNGNEFWTKSDTANCHFEMWDLGLTGATAITAPGGAFEQGWTTTYAGGLIGLLPGSYPIIHWENVAGGGSTFFDADTNMLTVIMDLVGTSVAAPDQHIDVHLDVSYSAEPRGPECFVWATGVGCTPFDFLGGTVTGGNGATVNSLSVLVVPEPAGLLLFGIGLAGLALTRRRERR